MNLSRLCIIAALVGLVAGCTSTQKRSAAVGAGAAIGAGAGYLVGGKSPEGAAIGSVVGAAGTALALGEDTAAYQRGVDDGYVQGSSDAVKRLYWSKQALEQKSTAGSETAGTLRYYVWEEEGTTPDGRKLAPEKVAVPVYEPLPKK